MATNRVSVPGKDFTHGTSSDETRKTAAVPSPYRQLNDPAWLRSEYLDRGRTAADIAAEVGCPHHTVVSALRRHGIRRPPHRILAEVPVEWLREQYVQGGRSIVEIASEVNLSATSVRHTLIEAGVPIEDRHLLL